MTVFAARFDSFCGYNNNIVIAPVRMSIAQIWESSNFLWATVTLDTIDTASLNNVGYMIYLLYHSPATPQSEPSTTNPL